MASSASVVKRPSSPGRMHYLKLVSGTGCQRCGSLCLFINSSFLRFTANMQGDFSGFLCCKWLMVCTGLPASDRVVMRQHTAHLVAGDDVVPRLDTLHSPANTLHSASSLMPQDAGEQAFWVCMGSHMAALSGCCLQLHAGASSAPSLTWVHLRCQNSRPALTEAHLLPRASRHQCGTARYCGPAWCWCTLRHAVLIPLGRPTASAAHGH